jgi:hypothetical protein
VVVPVFLTSGFSSSILAKLSPEIDNLNYTFDFKKLSDSKK